MKALGMLHGTPLYRFFHRRDEAELELDVALAARAMARRRAQLGREPFKAVARQICEELGRPIPPALLPIEHPLGVNRNNSSETA